MIRLVLALLLTAAPLLGATKYVATTGSDTTGDGSSSSPWRTIAYGVGQMSAGDTLLLRGGTYSEAIIGSDKIKSGPSAAQHTVISGYPSEIAKYAVTSAGGNTIYQSAGSSNITFQDFWMDASAKTDFSRSIMMRVPINILITNMTFTNHPRSGPIAFDSIAQGDFSRYGSNIVVTGSTISRWGYNVQSEDYGSMGVYFKSVINSSVRGNTFTNYADNLKLTSAVQCTRHITNIVVENNIMVNGDRGVTLYSDSSSDPGMNDVRVRNNLIVSLFRPFDYFLQMQGVYTDNNTLYGCSYSSLSGNRTPRSNVVFRNNIIWGGSGLYSFYVDPALPTSTYFTNNIMQQGFSYTASIVSVGNLIGTPYNPGLMSPPGNLTIDENSIAWDAGTPLTGIVDTDYTGLARPQFNAWDIGAYEFEDGVDPPTTPPVSLSMPDGAQVFEGQSVRVRITRAGTTSGALNGTWTITGTGVNGTHCTEILTSWEIDDGQASEDVTLETLTDGSRTGDLTFVFTLEAGAGYTVAGSAVTVTRLDIDREINVSRDPARPGSYLPPPL